MQILSVTLTNFKAHADRHFTFEPGTNAICGENGAGKTSILEAIAWVLFNYRGTYKNEDLIRNGSGSTQVSVEFISSLDGRTYQVERCTTKGYRLYDPQMGQVFNYRHIEDEVMPWLREHLGVAPGTDMGQLFANTIGVPQGTFTADFLQPPAQRKQIFDTILKVEEFRQAYRDTGSLEKYAKAESDKIKQAIAQYDESLQSFDELNARCQALQEAIAQDEVMLAHLTAKVDELGRQQRRYEGQARELQALETQLTSICAQRDAQRTICQSLEQSVKSSLEATQRCHLYQESYDRFLAVERQLQELGQQRKQQQQLQLQRQKKQQAIAQHQIQLTRLSLQIEQVEQATTESDHFKELAEQQNQLEHQQLQIDQQLQTLSAKSVEYQSLEQHLYRLRGQWKQLSQDIERLRTLEDIVSAILELEQQRDRLQSQLSRIEAAKQFETELQRLVQQTQEKSDRYHQDITQALDLLQAMQETVPLSQDVVQAAIAALEAGMDLTTDLLSGVSSILSDLSQQVSFSVLQNQLVQVTQSLDHAYRQRAEFATLSDKQSQLADLKTAGEEARRQLEQLSSDLLQQEPLQQQRLQLVEQLQQLDNPRGRYQILMKRLEQQDNLRQLYQTAQTQQAELEAAIAQLDQQLQPFCELETQIEQQQALRQDLQDSYLIYIQSQTEASQLAEHQARLEQTVAEFQAAQETCEAIAQQLQQLQKDYDPQVGQRIQADYDVTRRQLDRLLGSLPQQKQRLQEMMEQLTLLKELAQKRDRAKQDLKIKDKMKRLISFARKVYKDAAPRITEHYIQSVSQEADRLFRELLNRSNVALEWTKEYDIIIREGAHARRFYNLSGGEQMCAALAVRLALLRALADIDIAFFDEPTTNMDRTRRRSLAEAIANLKSFQQLFVISHDDTFEQVTENVIFVERES